MWTVKSYQCFYNETGYTSHCKQLKYLKQEKRNMMMTSFPSKFQESAVCYQNMINKNKEVQYQNELKKQTTPPPKKKKHKKTWSLFVVILIFSV